LGSVSSLQVPKAPLLDRQSGSSFMNAPCEQLMTTTR
jgi:hypothetical protein